MAEQVVHRIADGTGCYTMNQAAKALKLPYGNIKLFERLRNEGLLNLDNTPRQEQVNQGNFKVIVKHVNDKVGNKVVTLVTGKGLVYLAKRFNTEIDPAVQADVRG
jgi:phage antirepressor YoqD-like protein